VYRAEHTTQYIIDQFEDTVGMECEFVQFMFWSLWQEYCICYCKHY